MTADMRSFTAADQFPVKLAQDYRAIETIVTKRFVPPVHVQLCPTNKCTRSCSFCSCSERDKKQEMSLDEVVRVMRHFSNLGCRAVTITGGGEPLLHPDISEMIRVLAAMGISIGLVTNADAIERLSVLDWSNVLWCRISCSDAEEFSDTWWEKVECTVRKVPSVDWAFSYVVLKEHKPDNLKKYVEKAKQYNFTHVRVVSDLLDYDNVPVVREPADPVVIFQDRKRPRHGTKRCWISLLKPVVAADGLFYPCCGAQYASSALSRDFDPAMRMRLGSDHWAQNEPFDGSKCEYCYYTDYNEFLDLLTTQLKHRDHV